MEKSDEIKRVKGMWEEKEKIDGKKMKRMWKKKVMGKKKK